MTVRFCRSRGYALDILDVDYPARIPALQSGQVEFTTTMNVTPEREEVVLFSDPVSTGGIVCAVRAADLGADVSTQQTGGLIDRIAESFERNFIREGRWKLIVRGLGTTCLITVCSIAAGGLVAFGVCLLRRTGSRLAALVCDAYVRLLQGMPTVVLLMILYYVFLGRAGVPALWVAVLGFTLNFGAYGSEIMRAAIEGIGAGQREAALSLGYTEGQAFFDFIFPQAAVRFLPVLAGEAVNLLKSTSVVGYIAVQDLTKMSDIIRSRTYEAFFPLMVTAALYFVLAWVIARAARVLARRIEPRHRARRRVPSESDASSGRGAV